MAEFNLRSDAINVEQIMEQIRARIREKRGVDYTEEQIRELAAVKLEKFLDPRGVRSDLLEQFRKVQPPYTPPAVPNYAFEEQTLFDSHRAPIRWIRRLLQPILKLFFNPNPLIQALHIQSQINALLADREARNEASKRATEQLYYEVLHNLVIETTRTGIEVKNLKMQVESLTGRLEFNERRARALESAVVYRPDDGEGFERQQADIEAATPSPTVQPASKPLTVSPEGPGQRSRRRRRRRGRRGTGSVAAIMGTGNPTEGSSAGAVERPQGEMAQPDDGTTRHSDIAETMETALAGNAHPAEPPQAARDDLNATPDAGGRSSEQHSVTSATTQVSAPAPDHTGPDQVDGE